MRVWYDTEFLDKGTSVDLISIGMVAEDGRELDLVSGDVDYDEVANNDWLRDNVLRYLPVETFRVGDAWRAVKAGEFHSREAIRDKVKEFLLATPKPELWAWYAAYDHVLLAGLFGGLTYLPRGLPMFTSDLKQLAEMLGVQDWELPRQASGRHSAIADARHNRVVHEYLDGRRPR